MTRFFLSVLLLTATTANAASFPVITNVATESVQFTYEDQFDSKKVTLPGLLLKPDHPPPWNLVLLASNCAGLDDRFWTKIGPDLLKRNFAVIFLDAYTPRGFRSACENQFNYKFVQRIADPKAVISQLRTDNRFRKIALGGHSVGAIVSFLAAFKQSSTYVSSDKTADYDAFFAVAPSCEISFRESALGNPLLVIVGEKDDWTLPGPCIEQADRLRKSNQPVDILVVPNANHEMSTYGSRFNSKLMKFPKGPSLYADRFDKKEKLAIFVLENGEEITVQRYMSRFGGFLGSGMYGAHLGGDWDAYPAVQDRIIKFLTEHGF